MSSNTNTLPEPELLELLVQLQKTTPEQARTILNAQPAIGYALVPLMVKLDVVNLDVLQKTLTSYASPNTNTNAAPTPAAVPTFTPTPIPSSVPGVGFASTSQSSLYYHNQHQSTPPPVVLPQAATSVPVPTAMATPAASASAPVYPSYIQQQQNGMNSGLPGLGYGAPQIPSHAPTPAPSAAAAAVIGALGNIPEDQKEMIMRVIAMTPEQINQLPPQDRAITVQLRATLGLPTQ